MVNAWRFEDGGGRGENTTEARRHGGRTEFIQFEVSAPRVLRVSVPPWCFPSVPSEPSHASYDREMSSPTPAASHVDTRPYLLERVDEAAVVQLYADGFADLPLREKILIYHLYQAALAGRDIYYDQRYAHNLEMRDLLEEILTHADGVDADTLAEIQRYTKLFWINSGPYNNLTARKFVMKCTPSAFEAAAPKGGRQRRAHPA